MMTITAKDKEMLLQPTEASEFATKIVLASTDAVDVSPFEVDSVLHGLHLTEGTDAHPSKEAIEAGLPEDNQELVNAICNAADARESMKIYQDSMLNIKHWLKDARVMDWQDSSERDYQVKLAESKAKQQLSFENCLSRYEIEFDRAINLLNK